MTGKLVTTPLDGITYKIIGCAMSVHRELGSGLREDSYQRALANALSNASLTYVAQKHYSIYDDPEQTQFIGYYIPDFIVEEAVIVEIKARHGLDNDHLAQVIGYLAVSGCSIGLLINFGERSLNYRRVFPPTKLDSHRVNRQWLFVPDWLKKKNNEDSQKPTENT